jgi:hypothetical protein
MHGVGTNCVTQWGMMRGKEGIFVSYRRDDTTAYAGWLADRLDNRFREHDVFRDIGSVEPGMDFVEAIERALETSAVMLVVIGRNWSAKLKEYARTGERDYARLEVASALKSNVRVIPVLVQEASMPRAEELPDDLAELTRRNAIALHDTNWESDIAHLIASLEKTLGVSRQGLELAEGGTETELTQQVRQKKAAQGTIQIRRRRGLQEPKIRDKPIYLIVDDEVVATLRRDQSVELKVDTGWHSLHIQDKAPGRWFIKKSEPLRINVVEGEVISCICGYKWFEDGPSVSIQERGPTRGE